MPLKRVARAGGIGRINLLTWQEIGRRTKEGPLAESFRVVDGILFERRMKR